MSTLRTNILQTLDSLVTVNVADIPQSVSLRTDLADAVDPAKGAALVGYKNRTVRARLEDELVVTDFGLPSNPATIPAAYTAATLQAKALVFPAGTYAYNGMNFGTTNFTMIAKGRVILSNTGAGVCGTISGGASNLYNFRMLGDFVFKGNASSTNGLLIRRMHHSHIEARVTDVPGIAFDVQFAVLTNFLLTVSANEAAFLVTPTTGVKVDIANAGEFVSASWFNVTIEGINGIGFDAVNMQQCLVTGTSEQCTGLGVRTGTGSRYNNFMAIDIEQNGGGDIDANGVNDVWQNITCRSTARTNNIELINSQGNKFINGDLRAANCQATSVDTTFDGCRLSDNASLGIKGTGTKRIINCVRYNVSSVITARYTDISGPFGVFTPVVAGTTTAGAHTYSVQSGFYTVIGNRVFFDLTVTMATKDAAMAGNVQITGLPFVAENTANKFSGGAVGLWGAITLPSAGYTGVGWRITPNQGVINILTTGFGNALSPILAASITATSTFTISGNYQIAAQI